MVIFLDELEKILKKYNQPYTIHDWVAQMSPDKQNWVLLRNWIFKNGNLINNISNLVYNSIDDIFVECFDWYFFDIKFSHYKNYIKQYDLYELFSKKFSTFDYFYNPKKMKIIDYKIIYLNQEKFKKINFKIKKLKT